MAVADESRSSARPVDPRPPAGARRGYRAHLDGLRAVAVVLVVAFHADLGALRGAFIGVDVFFVLSGYLVTGLLIREWTTDGRIDLVHFFARRARRLLPAAFVVLAVTAVLFAALAAPIVVREGIDAFRAAFVYVSNWYFIAESTEYLGSDPESSPVLHYWSLSIEEQFYLAWPPVFVAVGGLLSRRGEGWFRGAAVVTALGAVASAAWALHLAAGNVDRAYFGTDARAYQLLLGATLALLPPLSTAVRRVVVEALAVSGLVVLLVTASSAVDVSPVTRGLLAALATVVLVATLETGVTALGRLLSLRAAVVVGLVSYAVYLWHLPVIFVLVDLTDLEPLPVFVVAAVVSLGLALATGRLFEDRIRRGPGLDARAPAVVSAAVLLSVLGAVAVGAVVPDQIETAQAGTELDLAAAREDAAPIIDCDADDASACTVREGSGEHVVLVGDSLVRVWQSAFEQVAERHDLTLSVLWLGGCSWHRDIQVVVAEERRRECYATQAGWFDESIPALDPDVVVLVHRATFDPAQPYLANLDAFLTATDRTVEALDAAGREVVIIEPLPIAAREKDPLVCLSDGGSGATCAFDATPGTTPLEDRYRELDADGLATTIDADRIQCPDLPRCDAVRDDTVVMRDHTHMTGTWARSRSGELEALLVEAGVLDP